MAEEWAKPEKSFVDELMRQRLIEWRKQRTVTRIERPTRLDRARKLGYKAKQGFVIARTKVRRGGCRKQTQGLDADPNAWESKNSNQAKALRLIAEERTARKFPNLEVLNSYWVGEDGRQNGSKSYSSTKTTSYKNRQRHKLDNREAAQPQSLPKHNKRRQKSQKPKQKRQRSRKSSTQQTQRRKRSTVKQCTT